MSLFLPFCLLVSRTAIDGIALLPGGFFDQIVKTARGLHPRWLDQPEGA